MKSLSTLIVIAFLLISSTAYAKDDPETRWLRKAKEPGISALQRDVYEQLARVHLLKLPIMVPGGVMWTPGSKDDPLSIIYSLGIEAVPVLAEALEDDTPTCTTNPGPGGRPECSRPWRVSEAAAMLIRRLAEREFAIIDPKGEIHLYEIGESPELGTRFRELIQTWYLKNAKKTLEQRKIEEVQDAVVRNRLSAIAWLSGHKSRECHDALIKRIDDIFAEESVDSLQDDELSACALTLGCLHDTEAAGYVSRICDRLAHGIDMAYRPIEQGRSATGSTQLEVLFKAFQGWALLQDKDAALSKLRQLYTDYSIEMEQSTREEYTKRLEAAAKW